MLRAALIAFTIFAALAAPASHAQGPTPRVVASINGYEGPSGFRGRPALVAFSPDGRLLALSGAKDVVNIYDAGTGKLLHTLSTTRDAGLDAFSFSPDGRTAATRDRADKTARIWDLATGRELLALAGRKRDIETKMKAANVFLDEFIPVPFGPEGRTVLVEREDDLVTVFEAATGREAAVLDHKTDSNATKDVLKIFIGIRPHWLRMRPVFSADGRLVVTANGDKFPKLWEAATGRLLATLGGHRDRVYNAAFSPDSRLVATCGGGNASAKLWDVETGKLVREFPRSEKETHYVTFSPDGRLLLTASDAGVRLWDAATGELSATLARSRAPARFSPDGRRLATGGTDKTAYLYALTPQ